MESLNRCGEIEGTVGRITSDCSGSGSNEVEGGE